MVWIGCIAGAETVSHIVRSNLATGITCPAAEDKETKRHLIAAN
jgi:hypothetical protein